MSIIPLIDSGIKLAAEVLKRSVEKDKRKYSDKLVKLRQKRLDETSKILDDQNDAKIERIDKEILIIQDMAYFEVIKNAKES